MILSSTNEADGFAIAMVIVMASSFGVIALIVITILRNAGKRDADLDELIRPLPKENEREKAPVVKVMEPWEREADWWKK